MKHLELDLSISFEERRLRGRVIHHLDTEESTAGELLLHTRELNIESVETADGERWEPANFELETPSPEFGADLRIQFPHGRRKVAVRYASGPDASGLQWLEPQQTAGRARPFLYSQGQSIHNRSWIPCFDDPALRITYDAVLRVPAGMRAVMAAEDRSDPGEAGVFRFHMPQPIPSYLIAMAVGDLAFRELGPRTGVWTEPSVLDRAAHELADTERMVEAVEQMFGPYRWGRYDVLILPPSFPLGGMENPRLTFATPTILAGDRSLVALIAHELAHSWSGNLVTNETWNDFWLNEGFTVYLERRIQERLYGRRRAEMEASIGRSRLEDTLGELADRPRDTWLQLDLGDRHPDDAMTDIPYEKGYLLLRLLEERFGRKRFDRFLRTYFDEHAFQTMTTDRFLRYLNEHLLQTDHEIAASIDLERWVYGPGLPESCPRAQSDAFERVEDAAQAWYRSERSLPTDLAKDWTAHEWIHFLRSLPRDLATARMEELDGAFGLSASTNAEILCEWLKLSLATRYTAAEPVLRRFLVEVGRRKFVKPLFEELVKSEEGRELAREIYAEARSTYHLMTRKSVDGLLADGFPGWR
jgi:leukotriene A-4 hydrolase/aminopeptidase